MNTKRNLFFPVLILCLGIILCTLLFSIFFTIRRAMSTNDSTTTSASISYNMYFLSLNSVDSELECTELGKDYMLDNFAGYAWEHESKFQCIAGAYENENDATLMKNKLEQKGLTLSVFKISFPSIKLSSNHSQQEKQCINNALNSFHNIYSELFDISVSLDNNLNNETQACLSINNVLSKLDKIRNDYKTLFSKQENNFISIINKYLTDAHESISLLKDKVFITPYQPLSSLIKYRYCEILQLNYNLIMELNAVEI